MLSRYGLEVRHSGWCGGILCHHAHSLLSLHCVPACVCVVALGGYSTERSESYAAADTQQTATLDLKHRRRNPTSPTPTYDTPNYYSPDVVCPASRLSPLPEVPRLAINYHWALTRCQSYGKCNMPTTMGYWHQRADERHGNPPPR